MDFGDILDEWDRQTARPQGKKKKASKNVPAPPKRDAPEEPEPKKTGEPKRVHPLTAWLRIHEVYDKDAEAQDEQAAAGERRRRLLHKKPDAVIDLHGLNQNESWIALEAFFQEGRMQGFEKLLIIHGKGNHSSGEAVLKQTVKKFIERCPFAGESGHGNSASGGTGATWVLLKKSGK
ncbi:MAG: Smr/MutS family protein [Treponema sp.]|jgi:DNA-nicking Smr family endonuclease|nr:Smr/MutS family protein [Treponema sp.]